MSDLTSPPVFSRLRYWWPATISRDYTVSRAAAAAAPLGTSPDSTRLHHCTPHTHTYFNKQWDLQFRTGFSAKTWPSEKSKLDFRQTREDRYRIVNFSQVLIYGFIILYGRTVLVVVAPKNNLSCGLFRNQGPLGPTTLRAPLPREAVDYGGGDQPPRREGGVWGFIWYFLSNSVSIFANLDLYSTTY